MTQKQFLNIQDEFKAMMLPDTGRKSSLMWTDLRPPQTSVEGEGISISEMKDWRDRVGAAGILKGILKTTGESPFEKIMKYDKQSMPSEWIGPSGASGYSSNWRHAGNTALLKNQIANAISPYLGETVGSAIGGVTSFGGGLLHELTSDAPIWKDGLTTEFKEDILANLFGSWKGQTGIAETEVLENLLKEMSQEDAWSDAFENLIIEKGPPEFDPFRDHWIPTRNRKPWEPKGKFFNPFRNEPLNRTEWIKKMQERKNLLPPISMSDTSGGSGISNINIQKQAIGMPEHLTPPPAPISVPVPAHISGGDGGGGDRRGSMPTGTAGKNPWGRADGGLMDIPLPGRSRYI